MGLAAFIRSGFPEVEEAAASPATKLPADLLLNVLQRVDLPTKLAAACVCKEWRHTCSDPSLWSTIHVPADKAFRLWDSQFMSLIGRCKGRLSSLHVSGAGITGKSLIRLAQANALAPDVAEIRVDHCCNLKACDILAFVQALSPPTSRTTSSSSFPSQLSTGSTRRARIRASLMDMDMEEYLVPRDDSESPVSDLKDLLPPAPPISKIGSLHMNGCKQIGAWEVQQLQSSVGRLDVAVCSCSRIGVLQHCSRGMQGSGNAAAPADAVAVRTSSATTHAQSAVPANNAGPSAPGGCPGLCPACAELFKGCGASVCGACWENHTAQPVQVLRNRLMLWQARRASMSVLRNHWTDFRYGVEVRSV